MVNARRGSRSRQTQNPGGDFSARGGGWIKHRGAVRGEALLRAASGTGDSGPDFGERAYWRDRPEWIFRAEPGAATIEGAVGQKDAGDRGGHRLAGSVTVAF